MFDAKQLQMLLTEYSHVHLVINENWKNIGRYKTCKEMSFSQLEKASACFLN